MWWWWNERRSCREGRDIEQSVSGQQSVHVQIANPRKILIRNDLPIDWLLLHTFQYRLQLEMSFRCQDNEGSCGWLRSRRSSRSHSRAPTTFAFATGPVVWNSSNLVSIFARIFCNGWIAFYKYWTYVSSFFFSSSIASLGRSHRDGPTCCKRAENRWTTSLG